MSDTQNIVVEEHFPHAPETLWRALTDGALIQKWMMPPSGFEAVEGSEFTFTTTPAGEWDGTIRCRVLEIVPYQRFTYSWQGGHHANIGYGSKLDTVVAWTLTPAEGGTRLRMVHSGFVLPKNEVALSNMSGGWKKVLPRLGETLSEA